jgi:hypothetical protein
MHRPIKVFLTLPLILWVLSLGLSQRLTATGLGPSFGPLLASFVIIHLRIRPRWVDVLLMVLITGFFATAFFHMFHYPPPIMTYFSFLGLSSFAIIGVRTVWERDRRVLLYAFVPAATYAMIVGPLAVAGHQWTLKAHPDTLDLYLLSFDSSLRVQLAFIVGYYFGSMYFMQGATLLP